VRNRVLIIVLAAVLALAGVVAILAYVRHANERAVAGLKAETVEYAIESIPAGTSLADASNERLLGTETVPVSSLGSRAVQSPLTGADEHEAVSSTVVAGQVILYNMIESASAASAPESAGESLPIPANDVAVTIQLCATQAGNVTAGSKVDVYATIPNPGTQPGSVQEGCAVSHEAVPSAAASTQQILTGIKVLSITAAQPSPEGTTAGSATAGGSPVAGQLSDGAVAVTLAVTPAQATELIQVVQLDLPYLAAQP
jgi:Flp pilus assembly protein CpaB